MRSSARLISIPIIALLLTLVALIFASYRVGIPTSAAGMAAKNVCSAMFVSGRSFDNIMREDILPASVIMRLAQVSIDTKLRQTSASLPGTVERHAIYRDKLGCMLLGPGQLPPPAGVDRAPWPIDDRHHDTISKQAFAQKRPWPLGNGAADEQWPESVDRDQLQASVSQAFDAPSATSTKPVVSNQDGPNTRALLVIHQGRLLAERYGPGFDQNTPQLGWSMAKSLLSVLTWQYFQTNDIALETPVTQLMQRAPRPQWVGQWQRDARANITVENLLFMRDGLDHTESKMPWSNVLRMLWSIPDIAGYAGSASLAEPAGENWRYSSAVSNLLSGVLREQFASNRTYWQYPDKAVFKPLGMESAVLETDASGTFIASSYLWATPRDWAKFGWALLNDGQWQGQQIFAPGWLAAASQPAQQANGKRSPYGAHIWQTHDSSQLSCASGAELPADGLLLTGHWGQAMGVFPAHQTVVLRLGLTTDPAQWDVCQFMHETLAAIKKPAN